MRPTDGPSRPKVGALGENAVMKEVSRLGIANDVRG